MFTGQFQQEKTYALIVRLRHNVIKTGIRTISLSYSRVSLKDIAAKLQLDNPIDAEYIIAKVWCAVFVLVWLWAPCTQEASSLYLYLPAVCCRAPPKKF